MQKILHTCPHCNKVFPGKRDRIYCSMSCRRAAYHPAWNKGKTGLKANHPPNGEQKKCLRCGNLFYQPLSTQHVKYCSTECYVAARWGASHRETRACANCGKEFEVTRSSKDKTCSYKCRVANRRKMYLGEKSHLWRGGKMAPYHKDWRIYRAAALERDGYKCVICGHTGRVEVHHINPYRYSHSHDLDNLVTLCRPCHAREEIKVNTAASDGLLSRWKASPQQS